MQGLGRAAWEGGREGGAFACRQYAIWEEWSRHELGGELEREMRQAAPLIIAGRIGFNTISNGEGRGTLFWERMSH